MRNTLLVVAAAVVSLQTFVAAQQVPDLTGTWVMDPTRSASAQSGGHAPTKVQDSPATEVWVIQQMPEALIIERQLSNTSKAVTYSFDKKSPATAPAVAPGGTTARNDEAAVLGSEVSDARAEIKDGKVVTRLEMKVNGKTVTTDETLSLSKNGRELTVERVLVVHHGYEGQTRTDAVGKDVFVRTR